jgi:hypothetical protein
MSESRKVGKSTCRGDACIARFSGATDVSAKDVEGQ